MRTIARQGSLLVFPIPALRFREAFPWSQRRPMPFPFGDDSLRYYYMARNGIYEMCRLWGLRDEEVLIPSYFHGVEVDTLLAAGVKVRFYPVNINMQVDPETILSLLSSRTRAIYMIHYLGFPGPVEELREICTSRGMFLIEDCALALLSCLGDRPLGSFGDASIFSAHKTLPIPNGGALLVRKPVGAPLSKTTPPSITSTLAYTAAAIWRHPGFNRRGVRDLFRFAGNTARAMRRGLDIVPVGGEYFDLNKANLGISRLSRWVLANQDYPAIVDRRRRNYAHLLQRLIRISPPVFDSLPRGVCPLFYPLRTTSKSVVLQQLFESGVDAVNFWSRTPPVITEGAFPETDKLRQTIVELPCHQDLSIEEMDQIADRVCALREYL